MRLARLTRRQWNNVIIIGCVFFIVALNLPTIIKTLLLDDPHAHLPYVLNPSAQPYQLNLPGLTLSYEGGDWQSEGVSQLEVTELVQRWRSLVGTSLTEEQFQQLSGHLNAPLTVEVWYLGVEEPQRVTAYYTDRFWVLKSWEERWLAVTVEASFLGLKVKG